MKEGDGKIMNIRNHFFERYCQRILKIEDIQEIKQYIVQNKGKLNDDISKMFDHSKFIYSGQLWDNITRNYHIVDNIILVSDTQNSALITLFRCDFGFGDKTNRSIVKDLVEEVESKQDFIKAEDIKIKSYIEEKEHELEVNEKEIQLIEDQKKLLLENQSVINGEIKTSRNDINIVQKDIEKLALSLCSSMDYKKELFEGKLA